MGSACAGATTAILGVFNTVLIVAGLSLLIDSPAIGDDTFTQTLCEMLGMQPAADHRSDGTPGDAVYNLGLALALSVFHFLLGCVAFCSAETDRKAFNPIDRIPQTAL